MSQSMSIDDTVQVETQRTSIRENKRNLLSRSLPRCCHESERAWALGARSWTLSNVSPEASELRTRTGLKYYSCIQPSNLALAHFKTNTVVLRDCFAVDMADSGFMLDYWRTGVPGRCKLNSSRLHGHCTTRFNYSYELTTNSIGTRMKVIVIFRCYSRLFSVRLFRDCLMQSMIDTQFIGVHGLFH